MDQAGEQAVMPFIDSSNSLKLLTFDPLQFMKISDNKLSDFQPDQRTSLKHRLIRQRAQIVFQNLQRQNPSIKKAVAHNKFGCICLQCSEFQKANIHFDKAIQLAGQIPYTNVLINKANMYSQQKKFIESAELYKKLIQTSPHSSPQIIENLPSQWRQAVLADSLNSLQAYGDAHINLSVLQVNYGDNQLAYENICKAVRLKPGDTVALTNLGDILRQIGREQQAIGMTWQSIKFCLGQQFRIPERIRMFRQLQPNQKVEVLSVKWGKRYSAEYVNKLYLGIKRNFSKSFRFICFTDDQEGLDPGVEPVKLEEGWKGWWGKATLFNYETDCKKIYVDLDTVITGSLDQIFSYDGQFATLGNEMFSCQKNRKNGLNTSLIIWQGNLLQRIYSLLKNNTKAIRDYVVRFDFWTQMNVQKPPLLNEIYKGQIVDYLKDCKQGLPQQARIVNFPRVPKPEECKQSWIGEHWRAGL